MIVGEANDHELRHPAFGFEPLQLCDEPVGPPLVAYAQVKAAKEGSKWPSQGFDLDGRIGGLLPFSINSP